MENIQSLMMLIIIVVTLVESYKLCQTFDEDRLVRYILFIGCVMRVGYMLYTPCTVRQHDLRTLTIDDNGNAAYILTILNGHLPTSNEGQFYHPPLYYSLSAVVIWALRPILNSSETIDMINCARFISCIFSCVTLYAVKSLCETLQIRKIIPLVLVAFLPHFYLMGGRVNNDAIALFFMTMILLFSIRWYKDQSIKNTVILALGFGLGMLSKMSVALLAVPTGFLMIYTMLKSIKQHTFLRVLKRLGLFISISAPLGLAYPIRNLVLFHQPFSYVLDVGGNGFASQHYSFTQRFLSFSISEMFKSVYNNVHTDYNVWMYLLKGALFGEFQFEILEIIPATMLLIYFIINLLMLIGTVSALREKETAIRYLIGTAGFLFIAYIGFNLRYPYGCTMDFRYVGLVFIINALLFGKFIEKQKHKKYGASLYGGCMVLICLFSLFSIYMFCVI